MDEVFEVTGLSQAMDNDQNSAVLVGLSMDDVQGYVSFVVSEDEAKKFQLGRRFRVKVSRSMK